MRERSQGMWMEDAKAGRRAGPIAASTTAVPPRPKVLQHTDARARAHLELAQLTCLLHYYGTRAGTGKAGAGPEFLVSERPVQHWPIGPEKELQSSTYKHEFSLP